MIKITHKLEINWKTHQIEAQKMEHPSKFLRPTFNLIDFKKLKWKTLIRMKTLKKHSNACLNLLESCIKNLTRKKRWKTNSMITIFKLMILINSEIICTNMKAPKINRLSKLRIRHRISRMVVNFTLNRISTWKIWCLLIWLPNSSKWS